MPDIRAFSYNVSVPAKTTRNRTTGVVNEVAPACTKRVTLTIDLTELHRTLCLQAAQNRTGKAVLGGGAVTAKVKR